MQAIVRTPNACKSEEGGQGMSILAFLLLIAAADFVYNREFTILSRLFGKTSHSGHKRGESKDARIRNRVNQARMRRATRTAPARHHKVTVQGGHWALRGNGAEARFEHDVLTRWKRGDVAAMLRQTMTEDGKCSLTSSLGRPESAVPAIYEWLCSLAWFYMSETPYAVLDSMNLTMDRDWVPLTCAGAGKGDIVIRYPDRTVLIEASLMNLHNQRRNEWEPTMRHTAEVASERDVPVYTLFVAPRLDQNTINVWKAVSKVPMRARNGKEVRCRILPVTSEELADWVERGVSVSSILDGIDRAYAEDASEDFDKGWRNDFVSSL